MKERTTGYNSTNNKLAVRGEALYLTSSSVLANSIVL